MTTEEQIVEEFSIQGMVDDPVDNPDEVVDNLEEVVEPVTFSRDDWEQSFVESAEKQGWTDFEAYVESGKDPKNWRPAREFVERGDMIGDIKKSRQEMRELKENFNARLDNVNKLNEQQTAIYIRELEGKRLAAVEAGDTELFTQHQKDIDEAKNSIVQPAPVANVAEDKAVDLDNKLKSQASWVYGNDDKALFAQAKLRQAWAEGLDTDTIVKNVINSTNQLFPNVNPNRELPANTSTTPKAPGRGKSRALTMADVSSDEMKIYKSMFNGNEKGFLQAVTDSRTKS